MNKSHEPEQTPTALKVGMVSLGCAKNLVDAEIMLGVLLKEGMEITNHPESADVVIVNTCSFIDSAQEESVETILESDQVREISCRGQGLVVAGCLPQRFRDELPKLLPEVDAFMGIDQVSRAGTIVREALAHRARKLREGKSTGKGKVQARRKVAELDRKSLGEAGVSLRGTAQFGRTKVVVQPKASPGRGGSLASLVEVNLRPTYIQDFATPRFRLTPRHFAYLKIAEGCNHPCSFCIIPRMRGSHRSRTMADILQEARALLADGVKEINLISQDSTYYGLDLRPNHSRAIAGPDRFQAAVAGLAPESASLCALLRELNQLPGEFWIRVLYTHPAHWTDELIQTISECRKVARYVDIPLQHIHDNMLERMRRETSRKHIEDLLARIRSGVPGIALRTTFIVGFPGETEAYFQSLLDFIRSARFERLGVFAYSREEGTRAGVMSGQVPEAVRQERRERAMAAQHEISASLCAALTGRTLRVLVEREASQRDLEAAGHSWEHGLIRSGDQAVSPGKGWLAARGEADAPDIDGRIYVRGRLPLGEFADVRITRGSAYDLFGEPQQKRLR